MPSKSAMRGRLFSLRYEPRPKTSVRILWRQPLVPALELGRRSLSKFRALRQLIQTQAAFTIPQPKPFPELFTAQQAALEDYLNAIVARRRANASGNEDANKVAAQKLGEAEQRALAAAGKYAAAVGVQSDH